MQALYQSDVGILRASLCIRTFMQLAQQNGAELIEQAVVQEIIPSQQDVTIRTRQGTFTAARLAICAGAWSQPLLKALGLDLPLQPTREQLVFFDTSPPEDFTPDKMPVFIHWGDRLYYGIGNIDGKGLKCARHGLFEPVSIDNVNRTADDDYIDELRTFLNRYIPRAGEKSTFNRVCLYTVTPDEHFIIDQHPEYPRIAFGAGFSGHGFKFAPLVGQLLVNLVCEFPVKYDLNLFRWDRFS